MATAGGARPATVFFLPGAEARLASLDPDRDWRELLTGERAWVLQTYLRLAAAGLPVTLAQRLSPAGVVVYHAKHWRQLEAQRPSFGPAVLVAVRGDLHAAPNADFEVVQNRRAADGRRRFFVPHWTQPGLEPRDPGRGDELRLVGYRGLAGHLHPELRSPGWAAALARRGLEWDAEAPGDVGGEEDRLRNRWPDYRDLDAVVSVRPPDRRLHPGKPPTKLFNAWRAGVPAVLGPESACRAERRDPLDYIEVEAPAAALDALVALRDDPVRYRAMRDQARRRGAEVGSEAIVAEWRQLLFEVLPERATLSAFGRRRRWPRMARLALGHLERRLAAR